MFNTVAKLNTIRDSLTRILTLMLPNHDVLTVVHFPLPLPLLAFNQTNIVFKWEPMPMVAEGLQSSSKGIGIYLAMTSRQTVLEGMEVHPGQISHQMGVYNNLRPRHFPGSSNQVEEIKLATLPVGAGVDIGANEISACIQDVFISLVTRSFNLDPGVLGHIKGLEYTTDHAGMKITVTDSEGDEKFEYFSQRRVHGEQGYFFPLVQAAGLALVLLPENHGIEFMPDMNSMKQGPMCYSHTHTPL